MTVTKPVVVQSTNHVINCMSGYLDRAAITTPTKVALKNDNKIITFAQLASYSENLAALLRERGLVRGDRVVCSSSNTWQSVVCFWAVLKAGGVISPIADLMPQKNLRYILQDCEAKFLVIGDIASDTNNPMADLLAIDSLSYIVSTTTSSEQESDLILSFEQAISGSSPQSQCRSLDIDLAAIIYTSGSTGEPKGVMLTHRNMITATESLNSYLGYRSSDIILSVLPLSFDYGLYQMIMTVSTGAQLILERDFTWPILSLKKIEREQVTIFPIVPTIVPLLDDIVAKISLDLSSVRLVSNTGAAVNLYHLNIIQKRLPNATMYSMYGLTECKRCSYICGEQLKQKPGSVGLAIPNTEIWIVDDQGNKLPANEIGEIVIRGGTVMKGYWNKPQQTKKILRDGPINGEKVLYTGDYGLKDHDGYLYLKGRMDEVLKSRGMKVIPKDIETFLMNIEGIKEAAIIGVPDQRHGIVLYAYVANEANSNQDKAIIMALCQQLVPSQRPEQVIVLNQLPKTTNGKIDKRSLIADFDLTSGKETA
ncbi:MAG: acyl--CoA ligase [Gammaproteobacteria bacterium]|nr:acyl--CoA ligase [Gammaproteobacteria bacterium]